MNFDKDTPLSRIKGETQKAHNALMDYFLTGVSLEKLRQKYVKTTLNAPPTIHLRTLQGWSARYHWQARIAQQAENDNAIILEKIEKESAAKLAKWQAQHMGEAEALAHLADQARGDMGQLADVSSRTDLANHPQSALVKNITQHYTQTTGGIGEDNQAEIKTTRITLGLYDAQQALKLILMHHGAFEKDKKSSVDIKLADSPLEKLSSLLNGIAARSAAADDPERTDE